MMLPFPAGIMCSSTACDRRIWPLRLVLMESCSCSLVAVDSGVRFERSTALLTRMSIFPKCAITAFTKLRMDSSSPRSSAMPTAV